MNERIYISEIQKNLQYKTRRSVRRWCLNNGLRLLCDIGSNKHYVLKEEFEAVKIKSYFTQQNCDNSTINTTQNSYKEPPKSVIEYDQKGANEIAFINCLQNI
ncbi:MAG: hypothetical protein WC223_11680 [Bacteroidales bacterium]|jgi:hypothetical protein